MYAENQAPYEQAMQNYENQQGFKNYLNFNAPTQGYYNWGNSINPQGGWGKPIQRGNYLGGGV